MIGSPLFMATFGLITLALAGYAAAEHEVEGAVVLVAMSGAAWLWVLA